MSSIQDHVNTLRKELLKRQISVDFVEEFLDSYLDQLESLKEEKLINEQVNLDEVEKSVLERCEPIDQVIKHVIEQYETQEIKINRYSGDFSSPESKFTIVLISRIFIIFMLSFTMYFIVFPAWDWDWGMIESNRIFYSHAAQISGFSILVLLIEVLLLIDVLITRKIDVRELTNTKLKFFLDSSFFKIFYRTVLLLCLVPLLVPLYIFSDTPSWIIRIYFFITILMTISAIEWLQKIDRGIKEKQILTEINPVTLLIGFNLTIFIISPLIFLIKQLFTNLLFKSQREITNEIETIFLITIFSLLFLLVTNDYWRKELHKTPWSIRTLSRWVLLWIPLVCILGITLLLEETMMSQFFSKWLFYEEFYQALYFLLFSFFVFLIISYIPQLNTGVNRLWLLFGYVGYSIVTISNLSFRKALNVFVEENSFMNYETYLGFLKYHEVILILLALVTTMVLVLLMISQKEKLRENPLHMEFYTWTFRLYIFFNLYEIGIVNLILYRVTHFFLFINTMTFQFEWLGEGLVLLAFVGLVIISEINNFLITGYETNVVKIGRRLLSLR